MVVGDAEDPVMVVGNTEDGVTVDRNTEDGVTVVEREIKDGVTVERNTEDAVTVESSLDVGKTHVGATDENVIVPEGKSVADE